MTLPKNYQEGPSQGEVGLTEDFQNLIDVLISVSTNMFSVASALLEINSRNQDPEISHPESLHLRCIFEDSFFSCFCLLVLQQGRLFRVVSCFDFTTDSKAESETCDEAREEHLENKKLQNQTTVKHIQCGSPHINLGQTNYTG